VAKKAQVSISTVSNALNDVAVVKPTTKARVLEAAAALNYTPNLMGKQLRSGETSMISFFTDSVAGPYFYTLVEALSKAVEHYGYGLNVTLTNDHDVLMNTLRGNTADGVIIFNHLINQTDVAQIKAQHIPTVMLDRMASGYKMQSLIFDSFASSYAMTQHLLSLGHRHLGYLAGYPTSRDSRERLAGFQQAILDAGIPERNIVILEGLFEETTSFKAVQAYLATHAQTQLTAFLAGNDLSAIGVIKALNQLGYRVPDDFSVAGFDDIEIAQYFRPALTTVHNPIAQQAEQTVQMLMAMLNGTPMKAQHTLKGELVIRQSTAKV